MDLRQHIRLLWRWLWLIVLCALGTGAAVYALGSRLPPTYAAEVRLLVYQAPASSGTDDYTEILTSDRMVRSYAQALQARPIRAATIAELGLALTAEELAEQLNIRIVRETQVMVLTVAASDPQQAAAIANTMVRLFVEQHDAMTAGLYVDSRQSLQAELDAIQAEITATQQRLLELGDVRTFLEQAEYDRVQMLLWQYRSEYSAVFRSLENVRMAEAQSTDVIHVIEPALPPLEATGPRKGLLALLAMLGGGFLAAGGVTLRDYFDETIRTPGQLAQPGRPVLACITDRDRPAELQPHAAGEALANRLLLLQPRKPETILVADCSHSAERSTVAHDLARSLAGAERQVVLVDAHLRVPPPVTNQAAPAHGGLAGILAGKTTDLAGALVTGDQPGLQLLPAGLAGAHAAHLLAAPAMLDLLAELTARADVVVIDGPPLPAQLDSLLLTRLVDATILVVQKGITEQATLGEVERLLTETGATLTGTVLYERPARRRARHSRTPVRRKHRRPQPGDAWRLPNTEVR